MNASSVVLDPRINAIRPDLADASLQSVVKAKRYAEAQLRQCIRGVLPLLKEPNESAEQVSEIRYGEFVDVFETRKDGYAWIQNRTDRYVGYMPREDAFSEQIAALSHRVKVLHTFVYAEPDLRSMVIDRLTLGSFIQISNKGNKFVELTSGGFIYSGHVTTSEEAITPDYVYTAGRMLGVPYLWGGRTPLGLDCSALVQLSLDMAGIDCPRDSDLQREMYAQDLNTHWRDVSWKRGDIVFFPGHVGLMTGPDHIIHANANAMQVTVEPLVDLVLRGSPILGVGKPS